MRIRGVVASAGLAVAMFCGFVAAAHADILAVVDKSTQSMTVSVNGQWRWTWPVSTGIERYDTPSGQFTAFRMEAEHFSKEFDDAPMPHSVFFTQRGHAIHGSLHSKLGRPASHGCVRLSPEHAAEFYALVEEQGLPHTKIVIEGEIPTAPMIAGREPATSTGPNFGFRMPWSDAPRTRLREQPAVRERQAVREQRYDAAPRAYAPQTYAPQAYAPQAYAPQAYAPPFSPFASTMRTSPARQRAARAYAPRTYKAPRTYRAARTSAKLRHGAPGVYFDPRVEVTEETYVNGVKVRRHYVRRAVRGDFTGWR